MPNQRSAAIGDLIRAARDGAEFGPTAVADALARLGVTGDAASDLALEVHRTAREHARLSRREHELSALIASARELAELRDVEAVLSRLVQRAREIMAVDVAYLSEFDPDTRELRVRETSGSVSDSFQSLRVPPGRGLASVVVESRAPQWVADYGAFCAAERHDEGIDDAVAAEGLVSLLGVPMLTPEEVLGVLFVANREQKTFTAEEASLLSALADHASVILQTAQTLRELQASELKAREALGQLSAHLAERDRASTVHQELVQAVLAGGGFAPVPQTLAAALGRSVAIIDGREQIVAASGMSLSAGMLDVSERVRAAITQSRRTGRCIPVSGDQLAAVAALTAGPRSFGAILLGEAAIELGPVDLRTIERAAQVASLIELQQEATSGADRKLRREIISDLLADVPERRADVKRRARRVGVDLSTLDALVLLAVPGEHLTAAAEVVGLHLGERALVGEYQGYVLAAFPSAPAPITPDELHARVSAAIAQPVALVTPGVAGPLPSAFGAARGTARLLAALGISDIVTSTEAFLPYSLALDADHQELAAYIRSTIGAVRDYDAERGTELLGTLRAFVRNGASPTRTARALSFHTNTILQRLDRLDLILGPSWREDERLFRIGVAVRLDELRERLLGA